MAIIEADYPYQFQMDYTSLEKVLEAAIATDSDEFMAANAKAQHRSPEVSRALLLHDLSKPIAKFLEEQPEFEHGYLVNLDNGNCGFQADLVAPKLVDRALSDSASVAIDWMKKILATESAAGIVVSAVWGLNADSEVRLSDDVYIVPVTELPESPQKNQLLNRYVPSGHIGVSPQLMSLPPKAALVRKIAIDPFLWDLHNGEPPRKDCHASQNILNDARSALIMVSNVPLIEAIHWFQFDDPELQEANFFAGTGSFSQEIVPQRYEEGLPIGAESGKKVVGAFNRASPTVRDRILISIGRFNQAMLRRSPGDKAVELSIALEALLVDGRGEHTHKVGLRAALMANGTESQRAQKRAIVTAIYSLRSALMHSGHVPQKVPVRGQGKQSPADVVKEGTDVVREVIRNILEAGKIPNWWELEVAPGIVSTPVDSGNGSN